MKNKRGGRGTGEKECYFGPEYEGKGRSKEMGHLHNFAAPGEPTRKGGEGILDKAALPLLLDALEVKKKEKESRLDAVILLTS